MNSSRGFYEGDASHSLGNKASHFIRRPSSTALLLLTTTEAPPSFGSRWDRLTCDKQARTRCCHHIHNLLCHIDGGSPVHVQTVALPVKESDLIPGFRFVTSFLCNKTWIILSRLQVRIQVVSSQWKGIQFRFIYISWCHNADVWMETSVLKVQNKMSPLTSG